MNTDTRAGQLSFFRKSLLVIAGVIIGMAATWLLSLGYLELEVPGELLVPFLIITATGFAIARQGHQMVGAGIFAGALLETALFLYLFVTFSRGFDGI